MHNDEQCHGRLPSGLTYQFQPILAADRDRVFAYETLVRRELRDGTIQGPGAFISQLLEPQTVELFTRYTLEFALERLAQDSSIPALSVNLSPRQAEMAVTFAVLEKARPEVRQRLLIELTEDPIVDFGSLAAVLRYFRSLGVRILLDDIAGGWHQRSISLLDCITGLKIDRNLLGYITADPMPQGARYLFDFATTNGLIMIAEGVEDTGVISLLTDRGVTHFQGFAIGEPWAEPRVAQREFASVGRLRVSVPDAISISTPFDKS